MGLLQWREMYEIQYFDTQRQCIAHITIPALNESSAKRKFKRKRPNDEFIQIINRK